MTFERLPKTILPLNYNLTINPNANGKNFTGNIMIKLQVSFFIEFKNEALLKIDNYRLSLLTELIIKIKIKIKEPTDKISLNSFNNELNLVTYEQNGLLGFCILFPILL
jgi:hypothetical protein